MKKFLIVLLVVTLVLTGGYFGIYKGLIKNKKRNLTYEQVVAALKVVCEDNGFSTTATALSSFVYADGENKVLEFNISQSYFKTIQGLNLQTHVANNTMYGMYDLILEAMSREISNNSLKLNQVKKVAVEVGTEYEQNVNYICRVDDNSIFIDWTSDDYISNANTGSWAQNTCVGYRLTVDYDYDNFEDEKYVVKQFSNIGNVDGSNGYSFVYQNVASGQIKDCGYCDFRIKKDTSGNIIKESTNGLILENIDIVNNKACFLAGEEGMFWYLDPSYRQYVQQISNDQTKEIVEYLVSKTDGLQDLPSLIYSTFCK